MNEGDAYTLNLLNPGGATIDQWIIDWGDNTRSVLPGSATQASHTFADDQVAVIRATAVNLTSDVSITAEPRIVTVSNITPRLVEIGRNGPVDQGSPVTISAIASDPGLADSLTYEFDLDGDGRFNITSTSGQIEHVFATAGIHTVLIRVRDDDGAVSEPQSVEITVHNVPPRFRLEALNC